MKRTLVSTTACATTWSDTVPVTASRMAANRPIGVSRTLHSQRSLSRIAAAHSTPECTTTGNAVRRVTGRPLRLRYGRAAPGLQQCVPDGDQGRSDEQAEKAERN